MRTTFFTTLLTLSMSLVAVAQQVNTERYITLNVQKGDTIRINLWGDSHATAVRITSGKHTQDVVINNSWTGSRCYYAGSGTMTVYGNVKKITCSLNGDKITGIDVSQNAKLQELNCAYNRIEALDLRHNPELTVLQCAGNELNKIDLSRNKKLERLGCYKNALTALDVRKNTKLTWLNCGRNQVKTLDISKNNRLRELYCTENQLSWLDLSQNRKLERLRCSGNPLNPAVLKAIYSSLPTHTVASTLESSILEKPEEHIANAKNTQEKSEDEKLTWL